MLVTVLRRRVDLVIQVTAKGFRDLPGSVLDDHFVGRLFEGQFVILEMKRFEIV